MDGQILRVGIVRGPFGNVASVVNAFRYLGSEPALIQGPQDVTHVSHLVLPGVGSFSTAMAFLETADLVESIQKHAAAGNAVLGICLGCQLLVEAGTEGGSRAGLGLIPGEVRPLAERAIGLPLPHTGWNYVSSTSRAVHEMGMATDYYFFNHEFYVRPSEPENVVATTEYGEHIPVAVSRENVWGVQFHPEKSQVAGLSILRAFTNGGFSGASL